MHFYVYGCFVCLYGYAHEHEMPMEPEEGNGTGVTGVVSHHGSATNRTLWKINC